MASHSLSNCGSEVRAHDRDRFLTVLFAPSECREALFALYAFNIEVAKIRETVSEPMLGQIRLQWWREAIDDAYRGDLRSHAVVQSLGAVIERSHLSRRYFNRLFDARERDLENSPPKTMAALEDYAEATSATLGWLALEILGASTEVTRTAVGHVGTAWALVGLLRALSRHLPKNRVYLPSDLMLRHGFDLCTLAAQPSQRQLADAVAEIADVARGHLAAAGALRPDVEAAALSALLPAAIARGYLRRLARAGHDPFSANHSRPAALLPLALAVNSFLGRY